MKRFVGGLLFIGIVGFAWLASKQLAILVAQASFSRGSTIEEASTHGGLAAGTLVIFAMSWAFWLYRRVTNTIISPTPKP